MLPELLIVIFTGTIVLVVCVVAARILWLRQRRLQKSAPLRTASPAGPLRTSWTDMFDDDSDAASTLSGMWARRRKREEAREAERRRQQQQAKPRDSSRLALTASAPVKAPPRIAVPPPAATAEPFPIKPWNAPDSGEPSPRVPPEDGGGGDSAVLHAWTMSKPHNSRHSSFLPSFNARRSAAADGKRIVPVMRAARCSSTEGGAEGEVVVHEYTASPARADVDKKRFSCERFSYGYRS